MAFILALFHWLTINQWKRGGNRSTRRKPLTMSFRKCQSLGPKIQAPTETRTCIVALLAGACLGSRSANHYTLRLPNIWSTACQEEAHRGLRSCLNMDRPECHSNDHLKKRGVEKGSGQRSILWGWEWFVFSQIHINTVSRATLGRLLKDGAERV